MTAPADGADPRPVPAGPPHRPWHGPASVVGVALGLLVAAAPYAADLDGRWPWWLFVVAPVAGLLLLLVPGRGRQVGVGLVASALLLPVGGVALVLLSASSEVLAG